MFTNLGNYNFSESELNINSYPHIEDMNNDGFQDMVIIGGEDGIGWLTILYGDGQGHFTETPVSVSDDHQPISEIPILNNYPNPFTTSTHFTFIANSKHQAGDLFIYNIKGQLIRKLYGVSGARDIFWDGQTIDSMPAVPGIYLCRYVDCSGSVHTVKILKIK